MLQQSNTGCANKFIVHNLFKQHKKYNTEHTNQYVPQSIVSLQYVYWHCISLAPQLKLRLLCRMAVSSSCTLGCYTYFCKSSYSGAPLPWCVEVPPFVIYPGGNPTCFESFLLYPGVQRYIFTQGHILNMPIMSDLLNQDQL